MQVWRGLRDIGDVGPCVVAIGVFDGVHRGHRMLIERAAGYAAERGHLAVALTFDPHPMGVVRPERAPPLLTTLTDRIRLLGEAGAAAVLVIPFTRAVAAVSPKEFAHTVLVDGLRASMAVVGADFHFGAGRAGDVPGLQELGRQFGFDVDAVAVQSDTMARLSSSRARELLAAGDVAGAAEILGRPHSLTGVVISGERRGRELGFPTANLACPPGLAVPADGVYAGWLAPAAGPRMAAAISVGSNPTFADDLPRRVEAYVIGRDDLDLYDRPATVEFVARLRDMETFETTQALVAQMRRDVDAVDRALGSSRPGR
ncbi:MAG TPA: bifunctional riboflavin kinase/FAD synthetase [Sporichthyaceae bacterium]|nr:bifunctional riboflavin kinase/FAD synthetase [Sporichthyaceae bacterium]